MRERGHTTIEERYRLLGMLQADSVDGPITFTIAGASKRLGVPYLRMRIVVRRLAQECKVGHDVYGEYVFPFPSPAKRRKGRL